MNKNDHGEPIRILLVEDNPGDIRLTEEALKEGKVKNELIVAKDGEAAIDFLLKRGQHAAAIRPDLILLDLNLPKKNGHEVLAVIKNDPVLCSIPTIILTSSKTDQDILQTYNNHANCYIVKPVTLDEFIKTIGKIKDFWFIIV